MLEGRGVPGGGGKGEKNWDNYNSTINKIYSDKRKINCSAFNLSLRLAVRTAGEPPWQAALRVVCFLLNNFGAVVTVAMRHQVCVLRTEAVSSFISTMVPSESLALLSEEEPEGQTDCRSPRLPAAGTAEEAVPQPVPV